MNISPFSLPTWQIWKPGQWPNTSKYNAVVCLLASFLDSEKSPGQEVVGVVGSVRTQDSPVGNEDSTGFLNIYLVLF